MSRDPHALIAYLESREDWVFGYEGAPQMHDCVRFIDGGVEAVTGVSPLKLAGATWTSERGARRALARRGGLAAAVGGVMTEIAPNLAQRGDAGMTDDSTLVLVEGDTVVGLHPERGQIRLPRAAMTRAWSL